MQAVATVRLGRRHGEPARPPQRPRDFGLEGRKLYLPQMPYGGSYLLAAAIRSIGIDAWPTATPTSARWTWAAASPPATSATRRRSLLGDFLRIIEDERPRQDRLPDAHSQRSLPLRPVPPPDAAHAQRARLRGRARDHHHLQRRLLVHRRVLATTWCAPAWRAVVAQDILMKMLLKTRPYEIEPGRRRRRLPARARGRGRGAQRDGVSHKQRLAA